LKDKFKYLSLSFFIVVIDQLTKKYFESMFLDEKGNIIREPIKVIGEDFFRLTLVYNPGIAFGIRLGGQLILSSISVLASIFIIVYILKLSKEKILEIWAFTLILGGAVGNLIDRALYGKVIDFLDFDFPDFIMYRWPVFNIADSAVTIGMTLLIINYLFFDKKNSKQKLSK